MNVTEVQEQSLRIPSMVPGDAAVVPPSLWSPAAVRPTLNAVVALALRLLVRVITVISVNLRSLL